jgi:TPR repeat protein
VENEKDGIYKAYVALENLNYSLAKNILEDLEKNNCEKAHLYLGWIYDQGLGVTENLEKAEYHYRYLSDLNDLNGKYYLAALLQKKGEFEKAAILYEEAADRGHVSAAYWAYILYGEISEKNINIEKANFYLEKASSLGHIFAQRDLALREIKNSKSVTRRVILRIRYYILKLKGLFFIVTKHNDMRVQ